MKSDSESNSEEVMEARLLKKDKDVESGPCQEMDGRNSSPDSDKTNDSGSEKVQASLRSLDVVRLWKLAYPEVIKLVKLHIFYVSTI
jgi:hypothetical protein